MEVDIETDKKELVYTHGNLIKQVQHVASDLQELLVKSNCDAADFAEAEMESFTDLDPVVLPLSATMCSLPDTTHFHESLCLTPQNGAKFVNACHAVDSFAQTVMSGDVLCSTEVEASFQKILISLKCTNVAQLENFADSFEFICRDNEELFNNLAVIKQELSREKSLRDTVGRQATLADLNSNGVAEIDSVMKQLHWLSQENERLANELAFLKDSEKSSDITLPVPSGCAPRDPDLNKTGVFEYLEKICDKKETDREHLLDELQQTRDSLKRTEQTLEASQNSNKSLQCQLESSEAHVKSLMNISADTFDTLRNVSLDLGYTMTSHDLRDVANSLSAWLLDLISTYPWIRSFRKMDTFTADDINKNPYQLLKDIRSELKEKTRVLSSTRSFVDDLGVEINGLKSDRARLREDLEMKEITIQKLQAEGAEKSRQIERLRNAFESLFEPRAAASFAKRVALQHSSARLGASSSSSNSNSSRQSPGLPRAEAHRIQDKRLLSDSFTVPFNKHAELDAAQVPKTYKVQTTKSGSIEAPDVRCSDSATNETLATTSSVASMATSCSGTSADKENLPKISIIPKAHSTIQAKHQLKEINQPPAATDFKPPLPFKKPFDTFNDTPVSVARAKRVKMVPEALTPITAPKLTAPVTAITAPPVQATQQSTSRAKPTRFLPPETQDPGCTTF